MTTGLTLQHLYSQQQQQYTPPTSSASTSVPSMSGNGLPRPKQQHHHHNPHMMNPPAHHGSNNGGHGDEFVADPLPFNYEDIESTGVFDERYRNMPNRPPNGPPNGTEKSNHAPMRYGSLLSGMPQPPHYHENNSYNENNSSLHHQYDSRRDHPPMMDRNGHPKDSYHYMPHSHAHSDQDSRPPSHYGIPELHSVMGHSNMHSIYHPGPSSYSSSHGGPPQPPSHSSHSYASLMANHHSSNAPSSSSGPSASQTKKELPPTYPGDYLDSRSHSSSSGHMPSSSSLSHLTSTSSASVQSQTQEAVIKIKTTLKNKYWRNGRRNLQCFPSCKVFGDYSQIKIEDLKQHDFMWGKCRGSLIAEVTLNSNATFDDILLLGRVHSLENIPVPFDEAVVRECMIGRVVEPDVMDVMKEQWIAGERLPDFINQNNNTACYEFKPKVWKYTDDMVHGKCKRRNVRYYVQFEAFVPVLTGDRRCYVCIGSGMSSSFEVGSSRVLARQKRKANNANEEEDEKDSNEDYDQNESGNGQRPAKRQTPMANSGNNNGGYSI